MPPAAGQQYGSLARMEDQQHASDLWLEQQHAFSPPAAGSLAASMATAMGDADRSPHAPPLANSSRQASQLAAAARERSASARRQADLARRQSVEQMRIATEMLRQRSVEGNLHASNSATTDPGMNGRRAAERGANPATSTLSHDGLSSKRRSGRLRAILRRSSSKGADPDVDELST